MSENIVMIENFVIVSSAEQASIRYQLKPGKHCVTFKSPSLVSGTDQAWVVTSQEPNTLQSMRFGFTSFRSDTLTDLLNIPTEPLHFEDEDDDSDYDLMMGVFMKPDFCAPINSQRCVVLVDVFLVTSPENVHYLIYMKNKERPFALAGIYDHWKDPQTGEVTAGFAIITVAANPMLRRIGVEHMPVILAQKNVTKWLDLKTDRRHYLPLIHTFPDDVMNGYPVSGQLFSGQLTNNLLQPIGSKLKPGN